MNTERLYRHCQCGDLLQEARGSREEEVGQKDHREGTMSESKPKTLFQLCGHVQAEASSLRHLRGVTSHLQSFLDVAVVVDDFRGSWVSLLSGGALQRGQRHLLFTLHLHER